MSVRISGILLLGVLACAGCGQKEKTTPELIQDLKGAGEKDRIIAARTLSNQSGDPAQVVPALIGALKDPDHDVRWSAAIKLGTFGEQAKDAIPTLQTLLHDRDARVREAASKALTRIDPVRFPTPPKTQAPPKGK